MGSLQQWRSVQGAYRVELQRFPHRVRLRRLADKSRGQRNVCPPVPLQGLRDRITSITLDMHTLDRSCSAEAAVGFAPIGSPEKAAKEGYAGVRMGEAQNPGQAAHERDVADEPCARLERASTRQGTQHQDARNPSRGGVPNLQFDGYSSSAAHSQPRRRCPILHEKNYKKGRPRPWPLTLGRATASRDNALVKPLQKDKKHRSAKKEDSRRCRHRPRKNF